MALFNGKDLNLPLLTQFYQLDVDPSNPNGSELEHWLDRRIQGEGHEIPGGAWVNILGSNDTPEAHDYFKRMSMRPLVDFHQVIRRAMNDAIDAGEILIKDGWQLNRSVKKRVDKQLLLPTEPVDNPTERQSYSALLLPAEGERISVEKLFYTEDPEYIFSNLEAEMADSLIVALGHKPPKLRRCPGCDSVFLVGRSDQRICSQRCNSRLSARKIRAKVSM